MRIVEILPKFKNAHGSFVVASQMLGIPVIVYEHFYMKFEFQKAFTIDVGFGRL